METALAGILRVKSLSPELLKEFLVRQLLIP